MNSIKVSSLIRTVTVGYGIAPYQPFASFSTSRFKIPEGRGLLPPVGNCTLPRRITLYFSHFNHNTKGCCVQEENVKFVKKLFFKKFEKCC